MFGMIPMVAVTKSMGGMIAAGSAAQAISGAGQMTQVIKARDEMSFGFKLLSAGDEKTVAANTATAKAKIDGEDVLTPLIQQSASDILGKITKQ
jgi:hypothetical protein